MTYRTNARNILHTLGTDQDNIIEKQIYLKASNDQNRYNNILYQIVGDILQKKVDIPTIIHNIKDNRVEWRHPEFKEWSDCIAEQNDFIQNPFEVEEGVFQCKACGSRRVYSYTRQDRSCDEGTSVYAQCVACKIKWRERG